MKFLRAIKFASKGKPEAALLHSYEFILSSKPKLFYYAEVKYDMAMLLYDTENISIVGNQ